MTRLHGLEPKSQATVSDVGALLVRAEFDSFDVAVTKRAATTTVRLGGDLDMEHAEDLGFLTEDACRDTAQLCLDLTELKFVDSCGLAALVRLHNQADAAGVRVSVRGASDRVSRLFRITGLGELFASV